MERMVFLGGLGVRRVVPTVVVDMFGCLRVATLAIALIAELEARLLTMLGAGFVATLVTRLRLAGC